MKTSWSDNTQQIPPPRIYKITFNIGTQIRAEERRGAETKSEMKDENHSEALLCLEERGDY